MQMKMAIFIVGLVLGVAISTGYFCYWLSKNPRVDKIEITEECQTPKVKHKHEIKKDNWYKSKFTPAPSDPPKEDIENSIDVWGANYERIADDLSTTISTIKKLIKFYQIDDKRHPIEILTGASALEESDTATGVFNYGR